MYRGEARAYPTLQPKIARIHKGDLIKTLDLESEYFRKFTLNGRPHMKGIYKKWDLLALAQHHGLPTRLLDWTLNPAVALYFAVRKHFGEDGYVWVATIPGALDESIYPDPFDLEESLLYHPPRKHARLISQHSVFTVHHPPFDANPKKMLQARFKISASLKQEFLERLDLLGFTEASLFPGLDGLAAWISGGKLS